MAKPLLITKVISSVLILAFLSSQVYAEVSSLANNKLAASLVTDSDINPDRSKPLQNEIAEKDKPSAIGNGVPLLELAQGKLPPRLTLSEGGNVTVFQKLHETIMLAIKLSIASQNRVPPQHQVRAKQALANLITLQQSLSKDAYLYNADVRGSEDYLLGFNFQNYRGYSVELISRLYNISPIRLAQYIYHECVPEKGIIIERDDHRIVYNEIQSAVFGRDEAIALKNDLRNFIDEKTLPKLDFITTEPGTDENYDYLNGTVNKITIPFELLTEIQLNDLRKHIEQKYRNNRKKEPQGLMRYLPSDFSISEIGMGPYSIKVKIRPQVKVKTGEYKFIPMYRFTYKGAECILTLHPLPYGDYHFVVGKEDRAWKQKLSSSNRVELILRLARMFGEEYESYFSGVGFGSAEFHAHFFRKETPLWEDSEHIKTLKKHLKGIREFAGSDLTKLSEEIFEARSYYAAKGIESDLFVHFINGNATCYLIPRADRAPKALFTDRNKFGTFGGREIAGSLINVKTPEAVNELDGNTYISALDQMSIADAGANTSGLSTKSAMPLSSDLFRWVPTADTDYGTVYNDYDEMVLLVDFEKVLKDMSSIGALRDHIKSKYEKLVKCHPGNRIEHIEETSVPLAQAGSGLSVNFSSIDSAGWIGKRKNICRMIYGKSDYGLFIRDTFYTREHFILAKHAEQVISAPDEIEAIFGVLRVLDDTHDASFTGPMPGHDSVGFHAQYIRRRATIWRAWNDLKKWPMFAEKVSSADIREAAKGVFDKVRFYEKNGLTYDIVFRIEEIDGKDEYRAIVIPRFLPKTAELPTSNNFGVFEPTGFFPKGQIRMENFDERRYLAALKDLSADPAKLPIRTALEKGLDEIMMRGDPKRLTQTLCKLAIAPEGSERRKTAILILSEFHSRIMPLMSRIEEEVSKAAMEEGSNKDETNEEVVAMKRLLEASLSQRLNTQNFELLIIDLDDTLLDSIGLGLSERKAKTYYRLYAEKLGVSYEQGKKRFLAIKHKLKIPSFGATAKKVGIDLKEIAKDGAAIDVKQYIKNKDERLIDTLKQVQRRGYRLVLLSNNTSALTENVLEALGIKTLFERIFATYELGFEKPDPKALDFVVNTMGILPSRAICVGNSVEHDIEPAEKAGMGTVHIASQAQIYNLPKQIENLESIMQISQNLPIRAQIFKANLEKILAEYPDQLFFMGIESDIGESQKAQIMPLYKAVDEIREMKDVKGKPLFPNLMVKRAKAEELVSTVKELNETKTVNHNGVQFTGLALNHTFIGARKLSADGGVFDVIKGEGKAWISAIDDSGSGNYIPIFEAITLNMMAYLNADITAIKNFYDAISNKPIDPSTLQDMIRNRLIYILPKATAFDTKQLRELYELAHQVYIAA